MYKLDTQSCHQALCRAGREHCDVGRSRVYKHYHLDFIELYVHENAMEITSHEISTRSLGAVPDPQNPSLHIEHA